MSKDVRSWHFNRPQPFKSKLKRWGSNPIGAVIRAIEFSYFRVPLVSLLKSVDHWNEVSHLNQGVYVDESDVYVENSLVHLDNNLILLDSGHILFMQMSYQSFLSGLHAKEIRKLQKVKKAKTYTNAIPLTKQFYYFHFVSEILPEILRIHVNTPGSYVLSPHNQPKFVVDFLELLKIPVVYSSESVVILRKSIMMKKASGENHDLLIKTTNDFVEVKKDSLPDCILLLRRGLARDDKELNLELVNILTRYGFEEVDMDEYSIESQVNLFRYAKRVVSLHGGALTNLIFCQPDTDVLEIFNGLYRNFDYEKISRQRGLQYDSLNSNEISRIEEWASKIG
jgi:capsular polysaccharide biosynthesis protein